jgi:surface antigen
MLAAPAAAETEHQRWLPKFDSASRPGNVEQGGREVNLRYGGHDRGKPPAWLNRHGRDGRGHGRRVREYPQYPPGHGRHGRRYEGRHNAPQPDYAEHDRRRHKHKHDRHRRDHDHDYRHRRNHDHDYSYRRHRHSRHNHYTNIYFYPRPYRRVAYYAVPYPAHSDRGWGAPDTACGGYSDGGRYVMGGSHEPGGTILGGIVGAAIGSQVGGGNGRLAAVGVGTLIGAMIGRDIGRSMDDVDRAYATGSFGHAMEYAPTCSSITWNNPRSGSSGTVTPTQTYEPEPGRYCREFQQQVVIGGKLQDAYGTACRQPDGSWEIVTE